MRLAKNMEMIRVLLHCWKCSHVSIIRTLLNLQANVGVNHCSIIAYGLQENHLHNLPNHHLSDCAYRHTPPYCTYTFCLYYSYVLRMHSKLIPQKNKLQINHLAFSFCQFHEHVSTCNCAVSSIKYPHLHITDKYTEVFAFAMKPTEITKNCNILN